MNQKTLTPRLDAIVSGLRLRRRAWQCVYPLAKLGHLWFGLSYKWVNVGIGAWHADLFDPLWQHRWYGDSVEELPASVNLNGMRYDTSVSEGLVQFVNRDFGLTRICFARDPHDQHSVLWYFEATGKVPASHIETAYNWVKAAFGGSFENKRLPLSR